MSRLIVVSNRVAHPDGGKAQAGGLAVALREALDESGGVWFGWNGKVDGQRGTQVRTKKAGDVTFATMGLSRKDYNEYYNGFANRVLWPLFHYRADITQFSHENYAGYLRTNALFASKLRPLLQEDDLVWIHDYHLIPIGEELRRAGIDLPLGFFLHTPWPAMEVMLTLPTHDRLVRSLCAYDVLGFQSRRDLRAFHDYIEVEAGGRVRKDGRVEAFGRKLRTWSFPIGLDTTEVREMAEASASSVAVRRLRESLNGRQMLIGVDRLDYSKGISQRLRAYETLLQKYPGNRNRLIMIQIAPASRAEVPEYRQIRADLEQQAGYVNGRFADFDWNPIRLLSKAYRRDQLAGFYRTADVGLVTPLRDGMNLVAKEYVAAQDPADPGVLVLSRFAGAAEQLTSAMLVNPFDVEGIADTIQRALVMPLGERKERWQEMYDLIESQDIGHWRRRFVSKLARVARRKAK